MAETVKYYLSKDITNYPTSNSVDSGKILLEENLAAMTTRITTRNYALTEGSFDLALDPDTTYGFVISIAPGQANIQGYHIIAETSLRVPPPVELEAGTHKVLGMKLARDSSDHVLGDVTYAGETNYEGVWVSYWEYEDAINDKDLFILGYLDWDGTNMSNVVDNPEKYGRLDASDIIIYLSDPKHPEYEFLTLQELTDNLKDWYVSKIGDDEYGEILWRTMDKPTDPDNWGISAVANNSGLSTITMKPSLVTDTAHKIVITTDYTKPKILIGDAELSTINSDLSEIAIRDIILDAGRTIHGIADESIIFNTDHANSLTTTLTEENYTLSRGLNDKSIDFTIERTALKELIGDALFTFSNTSRYFTLSGAQRFISAIASEFQADTRTDTNLYFGPITHTGSVVNRDELKLTTQKGFTMNLGDSENGLRVYSTVDGTEPQVYIRNSKDSRVYLRTYNFDAYVDIKPGGSSGRGKITFTGPDASKDNSFYKDANDPTIHVGGDIFVDGNLDSNGKVWKAVYN